MRRSLFSFVMSTAMVALFSAPASAQLRDVFEGLFNFGECGEPLCLSTDASPGHGDHFIPARVQGTENILGFIQKSISSSLGGIPVAAASGGITFSFNDAGLPEETSVSTGPIFAERAQTLGRGRMFVGLNVSGFSYKELRGVPLSDLELTFTHDPGPGGVVGDVPLENDLIGVRTDLELSLLVASAFLSYGVSDKLDIGVSLPFVQADLYGETFAQVDVFGNPTRPFHNFGTAQPSLTANATAEGSASGLGDISARIKYNLRRSATSGAALLADVRLPTGDDENFLGTGDAQVRLMGIASMRRGNTTPHVNAGILAATGDVDSNALLAVVGFDHLFSRQVTFAAELMGRFEVGEQKLVLPEGVETVGVGTVELSNIPDMRDHVVDASVGVKFSPIPDASVVANVLVPLNSGGMRPSALWTVGLQYNR